MTSTGTTVAPDAAGDRSDPDRDPTLRRDVGRGVVWAALGNVVMRVAGIGVTAVVARILSPDEFGVFAVALAVFVVVTSLAELGMASAVARSAMEPEDIAGTVSSISILVSLVLALAMAVGAGPLAVLLGVPDAEQPLRVLSLCLVLTGVFSVPGAQLVREFRQDRILLGTLAGFVPGNAVLVVLALLGEGATAFAWSRVVGQVVTGLVFVACLRRRYRPEWRRELVVPLLRFGLPLALANLINWTLLNADYLVIGRLLTSEQIGVYMIAFTVANWSTAVLGSVLNGVVMPAFGRVQGESGRVVEQLVGATRLVGLVALPVAATTAALAPELVRTVFGSTWSGAAPVLVVLAVYGACFAFTLLYVNVLVATGSTGSLLAVQVAWLVALVPAMVWGVEVGGLVGAAWAHVVVVLVVALPGYLWALRSRLGRLPWTLLTTLGRPALAASLAAGTAWAVARVVDRPAAAFLLGGASAVLVFVAAARGMIRDDLPEVGRVLHRVLGRVTGRLVPRGASAGADPGTAGPLRIGIVLEGLALGGCPINAVDLARTLRARGHHVVLIAVDEEVPVSVLPYAAAAGFDVIRIPSGLGLLGRARHLRRLAREHDLTVIHAFATWLGRSAVLATGPGRRRAAVVLNWLMENEFPVTPRTALVVGTGGLHREALDRHGPRAYLLEPPVDLSRDRPDAAAGASFRETYGIGRDELLLVLVSRVDALPPGAANGVAKVPGILLAMDALAERGDPRWRLAVVGDGTAMAQVRARADEVNARLGRQAVVLTGSLADPHPAYAAADVGLAMGGSALRVMAHGCPLVVLGDAGFSLLCTPETLDRFLDDGYYGDLAPEDPVRCFLEQVDRAVDERAELGEWGLRTVRERYGLEAAAARLEEVYRQALGYGDPRWRRLADLAYLTARDLLGRTGRRVRFSTEAAS